MIDQLREHYKQSELLDLFAMSRSSYNYYRQHANRPDPERDRLKAKVITLHQVSRGSAGSRGLSAQLQQQGESVCSGLIKLYKTKGFYNISLTTGTDI